MFIKHQSILSRSACIGALALIIACVFSISASADSIQVIGDVGGVNWTQGTVYAEGFGMVRKDQADSKQQRKLMARRAALNDAYRNLAETVNGVTVNSETTVKNMVVANDTVRTRVDSFIHGMRPVKTEYDEDEDDAISASVTIEAPLNGAGGLANIILPYVKEQITDHSAPRAVVVLASPESKKLTVKETMAEYEPPRTTSSTGDKTSEDDDNAEVESGGEESGDSGKEAQVVETVKHPAQNITGVVIDASDTEYAWNMFPRVVSEDERTVFDISVSEKWAQRGSFTPFQENVRAGCENPRVAADPIIVKAQKIDGVTVYISNEDADRIIAANNEHSILLDGKLLFIVVE